MSQYNKLVGLCYILRRIVNETQYRLDAVEDIIRKKDRVIIFYNFDYELDMLINMKINKEIAQWNGHKHEPIPTSDKWIYLVQYAAGNEGWNCTETDTIIFFSQNYSYKVMKQASGRIDRLNTPYKDLWYYHLKTKSSIDLAISQTLKKKQNFNENRWINK